MWGSSILPRKCARCLDATGYATSRITDDASTISVERIMPMSTEPRRKKWEQKRQKGEAQQRRVAVGYSEGGAGLLSLSVMSEWRGPGHTYGTKIEQGHVI